jgi:putative ATP-binding cassette transporter
LGEQQRLIFARLLLNKPSYAILDEATSALDPDNEKYLYQQLQDSGITFLSIGHRESLSNYHESILDLTADHTWSLKASETLSILTSDNLVDEGIKVETEETAGSIPVDRDCT